MKTIVRSFIFAVSLVAAGITSAQSFQLVNDDYLILSAPKARYTDRARSKGIEGIVCLQVELLANGQIGTVTNVTRKRASKLLKFGLVGQAIDAARKIQFVPKVVNGISVTTIAKLEYTFTIY